ncbi:lamin tail domain-containing protein [Pendulispora albinea]|uniref:Lamin tail domain-containing protein n=1 Tax=Pendulispora albinea TaxID=2741071 RepID=A0ABZ2LZ24_9BACT
MGRSAGVLLLGGLGSMAAMGGAAAMVACAREDEAPDVRATTSEALPLGVGDGLVISRVYGGGGNNGAPYNRDFVEIFNRSNGAVSLAGLSLQYGGGTRNFGAVTGDAGVATAVFAFPDRIVEPGRYFLVALSTGANGVALPNPIDGDGILALSATEGKIALARSTAPLNCGGTSRCGNHPDIIDMVGYGGGTDYEGRATPALSNVNAAFRNARGCADTNDNAADFTVGQVASLAPRNSATAAVDCSTLPLDAGDDDANDDSGAAPVDGGFGTKDAGRTPFDSGPAPRYSADGRFTNELDATCACRAAGMPGDAKLGLGVGGALGLLLLRTTRRTKRRSSLPRR